MESRFRDILDRVSRYIAGYVDAPVITPRYLQLPDIFSPIRNPTHHQNTISDDLPGTVPNETPAQSEPEPSAQAAEVRIILIDAQPILHHDDFAIIYKSFVQKFIKVIEQ